MTKLKYLLLVILLSLPAEAFATRTPVATENFSGTLANFSSINSLNATPSITAGAATCDYTTECALIYIGAGSFSDDQYAEIDVTFGGASGVNAGVEVLARMSSGTEGARDYFSCKVNDDVGTGAQSRNLKAFKVIDANFVQIGSTSTTTWTSGDKISIEVIGSSGGITVKCFHNSTAEITVNNETTLSTGGVGYGITDVFSSGDNWVAGNVTSSPAGTARHRVIQ